MFALDEDGNASMLLAIRRRAKRLAVGSATLRFAVLAFAFVQSPPSQADGSQSYPVGAGDELKIVVIGTQDVSNMLSGAFRVEPDGSIAYPLLGQLAVDGKTPQQIADLLNERLSEQIQVTKPSVSVAEYAPVYVIGDVSRTGRFEFAPGLTVFQLVIEAGGLARQPGSEEALLALHSQIASLQLEDYTLNLRRARLAAELSGKTFDPSAVSSPPPGGERIASTEARTFQLHLQARDSRHQIYDARKAGYQQEIVSVQKSIELHDQEVQLVEDQLSVRTNLAKKGLTPANSLNDVKLQLAAARRDSVDFRIALFRAKQGLLEADQQFNEAETRFELELVDQLREVDLAIAKGDIATDTALTSLRRLGVSESAVEPGMAADYSLVVQNGDGYNTVPVQARTELKRGEILRVSLSAEKPRQTAASSRKE